MTTITDILESEEFKKDFMEAIENSIDEDWVYAGEDEYRVTSFDKDVAFAKIKDVIRVNFTPHLLPH